MNSRLAMALSVAGVLAAGTGALALNTSVLDAGGGGALESLQQSANTGVETTVVTTSDTAVTPSADDPATAPEVTTFVIGEAGTITVEVLDGRLTIVDITTNSGWSASPPRDVERDSAEVYFTSSTQKLEAEVEIRRGIAVVFVEDESGSSSSVPGRDDDDHDDDDHDDDDDDYDDDDYDEDDD